MKRAEVIKIAVVVMATLIEMEMVQFRPHCPSNRKTNTILVTTVQECQSEDSQTPRFLQNPESKTTESDGISDGDGAGGVDDGNGVGDGDGDDGAIDVHTGSLSQKRGMSNT